MRTPADYGWGDPRALDYPDMTRREVWPGHPVGLRNDDVGVVMTELIHRLRAAGWTGPDVQLDEWGYGRRLKRWAENKYRQQGLTEAQWLQIAPLDEWSDHSWGTALDLDTATNPMYASQPADMQAHTTMPVAACPGIAADLGLEWGGTWDQPWDPQHWQVAVTPTELHATAERIRRDGYTEEDPMSAADVDAIKSAIDASQQEILRVLAANLGGNAVSNPLSWLNAGISARLGANQRAALAPLLDDEAKLAAKLKEMGVPTAEVNLDDVRAALRLALSDVRLTVADAKPSTA